MPFKNLFRATEKPADGLSQSAREAIVDVLHYCMYADKHIAISEDYFIESAARVLNWDARVSYEYYEGKSTGAVRAALADKAAHQAFVESLKSRLPEKKDRELALKLARDLVKADGDEKEVETAALSRLRSGLGL